MDIKATVKEYFGKHWTSRTSTYEYSNHSIADKIKPHERVIDIGCGDNEFKPWPSVWVAYSTAMTMT